MQWSIAWPGGIPCHRPRYRWSWTHFEGEAAEWPSSAMPISAACPNGRRACLWSVTCSIRSSKQKLDALCSDIAAQLDLSQTGRSASLPDEVSYRSAARSSDWWPGGLGTPGAVGRRTIFVMPYFPAPVASSLTIMALYRSTTLANAGSLVSPRRKAATGPFHSPARMVW